MEGSLGLGAARNPSGQSSSSAMAMTIPHQNALLLCPRLVVPVSVGLSGRVKVLCELVLLLWCDLVLEVPEDEDRVLVEQLLNLREVFRGRARRVVPVDDGPEVGEIGSEGGWGREGFDDESWHGGCWLMMRRMV